MMPDIDGYEVCHRIKCNPETGGIPIVFITTMSEMQNKTKGFELGAVDYILNLLICWKSKKG
jgi:CheY-like chemotaxis protein